jgi:hypothetical protein
MRVGPGFVTKGDWRRRASGRPIGKRRTAWARVVEVGIAAVCCAVVGLNLTRTRKRAAAHTLIGRRSMRERRRARPNPCSGARVPATPWLSVRERPPHIRRPPRLKKPARRQVGAAGLGGRGPRGQPAALGGALGGSAPAFAGSQAEQYTSRRGRGASGDARACGWAPRLGAEQREPPAPLSGAAAAAAAARTTAPRARRRSGRRRARCRLCRPTGWASALHPRPARGRPRM